MGFKKKHSEKTHKQQTTKTGRKKNIFAAASNSRVKEKDYKVHHHRHTSTMRKQKMQVKHLLPHCLEEPASQKQTVEEREGGGGKEQLRGSCFSTRRRRGGRRGEAVVNSHRSTNAHTHFPGKQLLLSGSHRPRKGFSHIFAVGLPQKAQLPIPHHTQAENPAQEAKYNALIRFVQNLPHHTHTLSLLPSQHTLPSHHL